MLTLTDLNIKLELLRELPRVRTTAICFEDIPLFRFYEMSTKQIMVFYLFYDKGMRKGEIAEQLGISHSAVRQHLQQAEIYYARSFHNEESSRYR